jgi:Ca2+/Na+ antiporter
MMIPFDSVQYCLLTSSSSLSLCLQSPEDVGLTGLAWLFLSYGYVLYYASNLISEGSELLLLVPSMAGLVGGVVLPLLGAVPDGAIILFSGLGSLENAQETLSVGVGALAGSTIMLLTVPFALSVYGGRVDLNDDGVANYMGKPKLNDHGSLAKELTNTGVTLTDAVHRGATIMLLTTLPYFMIQIPAMFIHGPTEEVAEGEHWWALAGLVVCLAGLAWYMHLQLTMQKEGQDKGKRMAVMKKMLKKGQISLSGAVSASIQSQEEEYVSRGSGTYQSILTDGKYPTPAVSAYLKDLLADAFYNYDANSNGKLDRNETYVFFRDFHETISEDEMNKLFRKYDADENGYISLDEFIGLAYQIIKTKEQRQEVMDASLRGETATRMSLAETALADTPPEGEEEEEVPEEFTMLSPEQQQTAIKRRAFVMLSIGTVMVVVFSDPMVDVMQEIAVRANLNPFYVSFILAPLASNASEVISSQYYASKKTRKTITVSLTALEGAACMNNTFCLSIFMGLIFFRGLAWQYTAETIAIVVVEFVMAILLKSKTMTMSRAVLVFSIFPLSIVLVAGLEAIGFD